MRTIQRHPGVSARRGFALGGMCFVLVAAIAVVLLVRALLITSSLPTGSAYAAGYKIGLWGGIVVGPLLALGLAWLIGWLVSLAFGKSHDAGNAAGAGVLVLVCGLFAYGTWDSYQKIEAAKAGRGAQTAQGRPASSSSADPLEQRMKDAATRAAELQQHLRGPVSTPSPSTEVPAQRVPQAAPPARAAPEPASRPAPPAVRTPLPREDDPVVTKVRDELAKAMDAEISQAITEVEAIRGKLASRPRQDIREIRERADSAGKAIASLMTVAASLRGMDGEASKRLSAAGVTGADMHAKRMAVTMGYNPMARAFAAESLVRTLEHAKTEAELMRDNIGKWKIGRDGKVESKDSQIEHKINSERFFLNSALGRVNDDIKQMQNR